MDSSRLDRLARALSQAGSRRGLLRVLAVVPLVVAGLAGALSGEDEASAGRRRRRKARHRRRKNNRQRRRKGKGKNKKRSCNSESTARTCAGRCGRVKNNCRKKVNCGVCTCEPACPVCQTCDEASRTCQPDPEQLGSACGELNEVCRVEGTCATCDVCPSGCTYQTVPEAIAAATDGQVIHICAGEFSGNFTINKSVILTGAGSGAGAGNTRLVGNEDGTVVTINDSSLTVTLQTLRIDSGDVIDGGGIFNEGHLALNGCTVTGCAADQGGGIYNTGSLILNQSSIEGNFALNNEGGGIYNFGGQLEMNRSQISGNKAGRAGGGLFNERGRATLNFSTISGNTATGQGGNPGQGGGIYNEAGTITLNPGSSVTNNNPDNCAGRAVDGCNG